MIPSAAQNSLCCWPYEIRGEPRLNHSQTRETRRCKTHLWRVLLRLAFERNALEPRDPGQARRSYGSREHHT